MMLIFFLKKIKHFDNWIYISFIVIPWIYVNLFWLKLNKTSITKEELKSVAYNYVFINLWFTGKIVIRNSLIFVKEWENWKKHTHYAHFKFFLFLKLTRKHRFNDIHEMYFKIFTY